MLHGVAREAAGSAGSQIGRRACREAKAPPRGRQRLSALSCGFHHLMHTNIIKRAGWRRGNSRCFGVKAQKIGRQPVQIILGLRELGPFYMPQVKHILFQRV
jgi:hypothetical protein